MVPNVPPVPRCKHRGCHAHANYRVTIGDNVKDLCRVHYKEDYEGRFFSGTVEEI